MVDGKYRISAKSPFGMVTCTIVFECEDNVRLKGTYTDEAKPDKHIPLKRGSYDGNTFKCGFIMDTPVGGMDVNASGSVDGDIITGKIKALMGAAKFSGTRIIE